MSRMDGRKDGQRENSIPPTNTVAGGIIIRIINGCELKIENYVRKLTARHHEACQMNDANQLAREMEISILTKQPLWILFLSHVH